MKNMKKNKNLKGEINKEIIIFNKKVTIPVQYRDAEVVMVFLKIPFENAKKIIDSSYFSPVRFLGGQAVVAITLFDYLKCDIGPFREFTFSIIVVNKKKFLPPLLPFLFNGLFEGFGFYVFKLGASSSLAREHIERIFPYPLYNKDVEIKIKKNNKNSSFSSLYEKNKHILTIEANHLISFPLKIKRNKIKSYYNKKGNKYRVDLNTSSHIVHKSFNIKNNINFKLGEHDLSNYLRDLGVVCKPIGFIHFKDGMEVASLPYKL